MTRLDGVAGGLDPVTILDESPPRCDGPRALLLEARRVPLGGVRGMDVFRALPQRDLPMVAAWCFFDRFGPQETRMRVEPHPHIGLQTVTWPLIGEIRHRDVLGSDIVITRGELNLMTSGGGIAHSEYSVGDDPVPLDSLQFWVALPESRRHGEPAFERHEQLPTVELASTSGEVGRATVVMGEFAGVRSPATAYTPIVGAEVTVPAGSGIRLPLDPEWEHAIVYVTGAATVDAGMPVTVVDNEPGKRTDAAAGHTAGDSAASNDGAAPTTVTLGHGQLLYLGIGRDSVDVTADEEAIVFLIGGEPFEDDIIMWWNFVGRSHDEIVEARDDWEADSPRFGHVVSHGDERIPAPPMPGVRLTRRRRRI